MVVSLAHTWIGCFLRVDEIIRAQSAALWLGSVTMIWQLIKRESRYFLVYGLGINAMLGLYLFIRRGESLNPVLAAALGSIQLLVILVPVMVSEQYEEKYNGDAFLGMLPVKISQRVSIKAGVLLAAALVFTLVSIYWAMLFSPTANFFQAARGFYIVCGLVSILAAALFYAGIFWLGYTRFVVVVLALWIGLGILAAGITRYLRTGGEIPFDEIIQFLSSASFTRWAVIMLSVLALFTGLMVLAAVIKRREK